MKQAHNNNNNNSNNKSFKSYQIQRWSFVSKLKNKKPEKLYIKKKFNEEEEEEGERG